MFRITPIRVLLLIVLASAVGAVAAVTVAKQQVAGKSEEDLRGYVDAKLSSRLSEEKLVQVQDTLVMVANRLSPDEADEGTAPADADAGGNGAK